MQKSNTIRGIFAIAILAFAAIPGLAAEFRLRTQCTVSGPVVTLGDIADIGSTDARQAATLAAIELFPSPASSEEKTVRVREIQDLLLLRGVNLAEHQFSGCSEVAISAVAVRPQAAVKPLPDAVVQRIKRRLMEALVKYLNAQVAAPQDWAIDLALTETQTRLFADPVPTIQVSGGATPWTGPQRFEFATVGPKAIAPAAIDARVRIIAPVVVALRLLARGTVIHEGDVELQHVASSEKLPGAMHSLEQALGHELVRAVATGVPVTSDTLRPPLAVHRGDVLTVLARAGGIRIRTNARAHDEGSVGELVAVESLLNRSTYYARVTGYREVEVYARPLQVENDPPEKTAATNFMHR